jgi:phosphatidylinositol glycan class N
VTAGYLGWIAFALTTVIDMHVLHGKTDSYRTTSSTIAFSSILIGLFSILWVQSSSWTYYAYAIFPVYFWEEVSARRHALSAGRKVLFAHVQSAGGYFSFALQALTFIGLLEALVS